MSSESRPILNIPRRQSSVARSPFSTSFLSSSPLAQESIARDIAESSCDEGEAVSDEEESSEESDTSTVRPGPGSHSMSGSYRRPSFVAYGGPRPALTPQHAEVHHLSKKEKKKVWSEEESLMRDNHLAPPKTPRFEEISSFRRIYRYLFSTKIRNAEDEERVGRPMFHDPFPPPTEISALLGEPETAREGHERQNRIWEDAVREGKIQTTWQREAMTLSRYSSPLMVTFILQYTLTVASIFTVGHLGKIELGAVSLASMTANITGYAVYQGLATSLDTLCAQAYGSGRKHLVGLQLQRMVWFLWTITVPIAFVWYFADRILMVIIPEKKSAELAGLYLKVLLLGAPGFALFESGKRFVQAQGLFSATTYVLLVASPLNAFMNWLFVWHLNWGFIGAPIAVAITDNLLPLFLFLYVYFVDGAQCWNGFTIRALHNWGPMIKLALPGLIMVLAEYLAFELLTLGSSYLSTTHLAAQSILATCTALTFQIPFAISIAASTRVANLIGATLSSAAKTSSQVALYIALFVGIFNFVLLSAMRYQVPQLFTDDQGVIDLVAETMPICAAFQLFDSFAALANGLLRGLGRQEIGGWVNLFSYYVIAMPISFGTAFGAGWDLKGLWSGVAIALGLVAAIEGIFLYQINWEAAVEEAQDRNNSA